jgi:hypothetical protein
VSAGGIVTGFLGRIRREMGRQLTPTREPGTVKGLANGLLTVQVAGKTITTYYTGSDDLRENDGVWMQRDPDDPHGNNYWYTGARGTITRSGIPTTRTPIHSGSVSHITDPIVESIAAITTPTVVDSDGNEFPIRGKLQFKGVGIFVYYDDANGRTVVYFDNSYDGAIGGTLYDATGVTYDDAGVTYDGIP